MEKTWRFKNIIRKVVVLIVLTVNPVLNAQSSFENFEKQATEADRKGNYEQALQLSKKALTAAENEFGRRSEAYRLTLFNVAIFNSLTNNYLTAIQHFEKAAEYYKPLYDKDPLSLENEGLRYEECWYRIAEIYSDIGEFSQAEESYLKAVNLSKQREYDPRHWSYLKETAEFYVEKLSNYAVGINYYQQNLELIEEYHRKGYRYIERLIGLAYIYLNIGEYDQALKSFSEATGYFESKNNEGKIIALSWPGDYISSLVGIAGTYELTNELEKGLAVFDKTTKFIHENLGEENAYLVYLNLNKVGIYERSKRYDEAVRLLQETMSLLRANNIDIESSYYRSHHYSLGRIYGLKGEYEKSEEYLAKVVEMDKNRFGEQSFEYAQSLYSLAVTYDKMDLEDKAEELFFKYLNINHSFLESNFTTLTANQRASLWSRYNESEKLHYQVIDGHEENPIYVEKGYDYLLKTKGYLLQNTTGFYRAVNESEDAAIQIKLDQWLSIRSKIATALNMPESDWIKKDIDIDVLESEAINLEQDIAESINFSPSLTEKPVTWKQVQSALGKDEAAIEIVRVREYQDETKGFVAVHYGAYVLKSTGKPEFLVFPNGDKIEKIYLKRYRNSIKQKKQDPENYRIFWQPLNEKLNNVSTVYISPDGVFHQINLNTIQNPETNKFLLDEFEIRTVTKTSDIIIKNQPPKNSDKKAILMGRPQFKLNSSGDVLSGNSSIHRQISSSRISRSGLENASWTDLPGTETEIREISKMLR